MRTGFIERREIQRPDGVGIERFEIVELISGRPHRSLEGWETHHTLAEALKKAAEMGIEIVDQP